MTAVPTPCSPTSQFRREKTQVQKDGFVLPQQQISWSQQYFVFNLPISVSQNSSSLNEKLFPFLDFFRLLSGLVCVDIN